jgi:hypothetical protein
MRVNDFDVTLYKSDGTIVPQGNHLLTLTNGTTYYAEIAGGGEGSVSAWQWIWAATIVADISYESTNLSNQEITVFAAASAGWSAESTSLDLNIPGGAAGSHMEHMSNFGARRLRAKIVVTTGGTAQLRGRCHVKAPV